MMFAALICGSSLRAFARFGFWGWASVMWRDDRAGIRCVAPQTGSDKTSSTVMVSSTDNLQMKDLR